MERDDRTLQSDTFFLYFSHNEIAVESNVQREFIYRQIQFGILSSPIFNRLTICLNVFFFFLFRHEAKFKQVDEKSKKLSFRRG